MCQEQESKKNEVAPKKRPWGRDWRRLDPKFRDRQDHLLALFRKAQNEPKETEKESNT